MNRLSVASPVGELTLSEVDGALVALAWGPSARQVETPLLREAKRQLERYFAGDMTPFDLPLKPEGSPFQKRVWAALGRIPAGETRSYGALAAEIGSVPRAVGGACGANPIPIIVPCHRVLGAGGRLGGYSGAGGGATKRALLQLEGACRGEARQFELL